ncbi:MULTISPECIES: hypothetical protein [Streptomyces]|uniref:Secreted protein n=1 Tax=Streptomyces solicathayae TaxID=3081768 RepID=A0ABZ0LWJ3_9ACTN|nr:hypothetical protein [Streptomyces sp. HUAS YS2]WOX23794.1 hypothetical protein R2D22_21375 [Streptomyces sp. HUAS YS2]
MKLRHVRAVAVFGIAVVALTGARGSHGASCGGSHGSSSSSSSSGGSSSSGSDSTSGGSSTGSVSGVGGSSRDKAQRDIRIDECKLSDDRKNLVAKITITNSDSTAYLYDVSLQFKGDASANIAMANVDDLRVEGGASQSTEATTPYTGTGDGSEYTKCVVVTADRSIG